MRKKLAAVGVALLLAGFLAVPTPRIEAPLSPVVLDCEGTVMKVFRASDDSWRILFPADKPVPEKLEKALVLYEDRRFFLHPGVDPAALVRAVMQDVRAGRAVSGGSTLTMQVARLSRPKPRTVLAKLLEMLQAVKLEALYSKGWILRHYLTFAPYGGNTVGIRAAAFRYFGRDVDALTWAETCTLAVLPRSPSQVNLQREADRLLARRDALLKRLYEEGTLSEPVYRASLRERLPSSRYSMPGLAPHLCLSLAVAHGGGIVRSSIDPALQRSAETLVRQWTRDLATYGIHNAALVVAETGTGKVRAYVGSQDFEDSQFQGQVDGVLAPRSSGSILKPFLYALAMQQGRLAGQTLLPDVPMRFGEFEPVNAGETYSGAATVHQCLVQSLNVPAVFVLREFGVESFYAFLKDAGISTLHRSPQTYGLSLIIGGAEVSLWDVAALYRGLGRGGVFAPISALEREEDPAARRLLNPGAAYLVLDILRDVRRPGYEYTSVLAPDAFPIAWKTGTSFHQRDAWAIGVSPDWVIGVWAGNFSGEPNPNLMGAKVAGQLLFQEYQQLPKTRGWFSEPSDDVKTVALCGRSGFAWTPACGEPSHAVMPTSAPPLPPCPYHRTFFVSDADGREVCSLCWLPGRYHRETRLVFTPKVAAYLRKAGSPMQERPRHEPSCPAYRQANVLQILYPLEASRILLPRDYGGAAQPLVLRVAAEEGGGSLLWFVDQRYVARTVSAHEVTVALAPGGHRLTVVDERGRSQSVEFEVVSRNSG